MTELKTLGFLATGLLYGFHASIALSSQKPDLALQIARVSVNEGALRYRVTTALVWQVVRENGGKTVAKMSEFLAKHSPRVAGNKPCHIGNCFWTPYLMRTDAKPFGLKLKDDYWTKSVLPFWRDALAYADWLVAGKHTADDPCAVKPQTWGGPMDRARAIKTGLYPIGCRSMDACTTASCNDGFTMKAHCWKSGTWVCDPTLNPNRRSLVADALAVNVQSLPAPR